MTDIFKTQNIQYGLRKAQKALEENSIAYNIDSESIYQALPEALEGILILYYTDTQESHEAMEKLLIGLIQQMKNIQPKH